MSIKMGKKVMIHKTQRLNSIDFYISKMIQSNRTSKMLLLFCRQSNELFIRFNYKNY